MLFIVIYCYYIYIYLYDVFLRMPNPVRIEDLRQWLKYKKDQYNWSYSDLSKFCEYSESGVREAIKNNTINYQSIIDIIVGKGIYDVFIDEFYGNIYKKSKLSNTTLIRMLIERKSELEKDILFKSFVETFYKKNNPNK